MKAAGEFKPATRVLDGITAGIEKRSLIWMAQRAPRWVNSDHLTLLGLFGMVGAGFAYWGAATNPAWLWVVNLCIVLNWLGDSLDGTVARVRDQQRPRYGFYVDHVVDAISSVFLFGGMALSGYMSPAIAAGLLIVYLLVAAESYLATYTVGRFELSHFGFGPTELRLLIIVGNCFLFDRPQVPLFGHSWPLFDFGGAIAMVCMAVVFIVAAIKNTARLYREETR
jgi:archaetidylinositol phosphate synthase